MRSTVPSVLAPLALAAVAAAQTTWYVDAAGTPPGSGTPRDPWTSIQHALDQPATTHGDTVLVAPGTYVENLDYADQGIAVVAAEGPTRTEIVPADPAVHTVQRGKNETPWSVLRGFTLRGNTGAAAVFSDFTQGMVVERCIVRDNATGLLNLYDMQVTNCTVVGNQVGLVHWCVHAASITTVDASVFWSNGTDFGGDGFGTEWFAFANSTFDVDPLFFAADDVHLQAGSPCIDAGTPGALDPDGSPLDVGALPFDPCWPLGESVCTPAENSSGARATMRLSGSASVSANDLVLSATGCPLFASGIFFYGPETAYYPLGDGFVCIGGELGRLPAAPTGPLGTPVLALDLTQHQAPHLPPILPGEERLFQYWFRDVLGAGGGFNFANAVRVRFEP